MRRLARAILLAFALGSLALTLWSGWQVWQSPGLTPVRERTTQEIVAATDRMMAREATAERLSALIAGRLAEDPRNWVTLQALRAVVAERGLAVDPAVLATYDAAWDEDSGVWATASACTACVLDVNTCSLNTALLCKMPVAMTPVDDVRGVMQAAWDYSTGQEIDYFDAGVSMVGLAATGLIMASGGSSTAIKVGTATAKTARGMKLVSKPLEQVVVHAARDGVDWGGVSLVRLVDDPASLVRPAAIRPILDLTDDLGVMYRSTDTVTTLHLLRYIDDAGEARAMARASEALGVRTVARAEVLGPTRLMRATLRVGELGWQLTAGLVGLAWALASMLAGTVQGAGLRALRRMLRVR